MAGYRKTRKKLEHLWEPKTSGKRTVQPRQPHIQTSKSATNATSTSPTCTPSTFQYTTCSGGHLQELEDMDIIERIKGPTCYYVMNEPLYAAN